MFPNRRLRYCLANKQIRHSPLGNCLTFGFLPLHFSEFFVCKDKGELIAAGRVREYEDGVFELCSLGVLEDYRGAGIGTDIVKALLQKHSLDSVYVVTEIPEFFEKTGFVKSTHKSEYLQDKLKRCVEEYACKNPIIMLCKHI